MPSSCRSSSPCGCRTRSQSPRASNRVPLTPGTTGLLFVCAATGLLQLRCAPEMRGRILALSTVVVFGGIALGSPLLGWLCEALGPRWGLYLAALAVTATGAAVLVSRAGTRR